MIDDAITWLLGHPMSGVGLLVVFAVGFGVVLIPRVHEMVVHGPPRC